jgi:hypothetical protein
VVTECNWIGDQTGVYCDTHDVMESPCAAALKARVETLEGALRQISVRAARIVGGEIKTTAWSGAAYDVEVADAALNAEAVR